ncbi:neural cell adhesion molecule 1-like isoform X1 [Clytia hemisphaerica]|uniref:neural cell adhesion molecule 1-like isoform X1 n=1 Tax=Clytia hemisphaerica TaxID=252671 RepID=UPI0034D462CA
MEKLSWLFVFCFGLLSLYNFLQVQELRENRLQDSSEISNEDGKQRYRRDLEENEEEDIWRFIFNREKFTKLIRRISNETYQDEIIRSLAKFVPTERLCKDFVENCRSKAEFQEKDYIIKTEHSKSGLESEKNRKFLRGPPGPPGPPGPQGPRGPGLESPKLVSNSLNHGLVNITKSKTFECVFYGNPIPEVSWESSAKDFEISSVLNKEKSEIKTQLVVYNTSWSDQGPVKCSARSILGEASHSGNLTVLSKPVIQNQKTLVFAPQGINFRFPPCEVRSNPPAKITWKRIFWSMPAGRFEVQANTLTIGNLQFSDEGFYVCEAENFLGKDKSTLQLKVKAFEMQKTSVSSINIYPSEIANISCSALGNAVKMDGKITKAGAAVDYKVDRSADNNTITVIASVKEKGAYVCSISNAEETLEVAVLVHYVELGAWSSWSCNCESRKKTRNRICQNESPMKKCRARKKETTSCICTCKNGWKKKSNPLLC